MKKNRIKESAGDRVFQAVAVIIFLIITIICAYPFYYLMICTISDQKLVDLNLITLIPKGINFQNYIEIFKVQNLANSALVSVLRTVITTAVSLVCTSYMAYFFTKKNMWGHKFWYRFTVVTMYFSAGLIPVYLNNKMLGLVNSFWVYVIPASISVYNMVLVKTNIEAMGPDLEESAYLDGAGYLTRFFKIVLPLQTPILATVSLFTAVNQWNDFFTTKLYITNTKLYTLQFLLYELLADPDSQLITSSGPDGDFWYSDENGDAYFTDAALEYLQSGNLDFSGYTLSNGEELSLWNTPFITNTGVPTSYGDGEGGKRCGRNSAWKEKNEISTDNETFHQWQATTGYENWQEWLAAEDAFASESRLDYVRTFESIPDDMMQLTVDAIKDKVVTASWKMIYSETDDEFEQLWDQMVSDCEGLGAQEIIDWRLADIENAIAIRDSLAK